MKKENTFDKIPPDPQGKFTEGLPDTPRILNVLKLTPGQVVIDAGCGTGYMAELFSKAVAPSGRVYAIDRDRHFIEPLKNLILPMTIFYHYPSAGGAGTRLRVRDFPYLFFVLHICVSL